MVMGHSSISLSADRLAGLFGLRRVLHVTQGDASLTHGLLAQGVDAYRYCVLNEGDRTCDGLSGRIFYGNAGSTPFPDAQFDTVVVDGVLGRYVDEGLDAVISELTRICRKNLYIELPPPDDPEKGREWWERKFLLCGFRKHPAYFLINDYEALNRTNDRIRLVLEAAPKMALERYPLSASLAEQDLHMDMLRHPGVRSDAHVIRYHWATNYIKPGDRVLDAACGLGYGAHLMRCMTRAGSVLGVDGSAFAVDYARAFYGMEDGSVSFEQGWLPQKLASYEAGSFDLIASFETLEHVEDPRGLIAEFKRLLVPGGRLLVSVPNDWSDETGEDPNPHHLHVYDWERLESELTEHFIAEEGFALSASQFKVPGTRATWQRSQRSLRKVAVGEPVTEPSEWCLMAAMKSPAEATPAIPYQERVFQNLVKSGHPSVAYQASLDNPWLMHSLVNVSYRLRNTAALTKFAQDLVATLPPGANDRRAALCVWGYRLVESAEELTGDVVKAFLGLVDEEICHADGSAHAVRWSTSLLFLKARLLEVGGDLPEATRTYIACAEQNIAAFGIHLATKTTEACYRAGRLAYALGDETEAFGIWMKGFELGRSLLNMDVSEILISPDFPNLFNHGDGVREYAVAWDNIARCANGIHLLRSQPPFDVRALDSCLQSEYRIVTDDLVGLRTSAQEVVSALNTANKDLGERTDELVQTRGFLVARTRDLERTVHELNDRTAELVEVRRILSERTALLEELNNDLERRARDEERAHRELAERSERLERAYSELADNRALLTDRTKRLEGAISAAAELSSNLNEVRGELIDRTERLERAHAELEKTQCVLAERTEALEEAVQVADGLSRDLNEVRAELIERTKRLEHTFTLLESTQSVLEDRTQSLENAAQVADSLNNDLAEARSVLVERTEHLNLSRRTVEALTTDLVQTRGELASRTELLTAASNAGTALLADLTETRQALQSRTEQSNQLNAELATRTTELEYVRDVLVDRTARLEQAEVFLQEARLNILNLKLEIQAVRVSLREKTEECSEANKMLETAKADLTSIINAPFYKRVFIRKHK